MESTMQEEFEEFWDENYGDQYNYAHNLPLEPYWSIASYAWEEGYFAGQKAK